MVIGQAGYWPEAPGGASCHLPVHPFSQITYAEAVSGDAGLLLGLLGFKVLMTG